MGNSLTSSIVKGFGFTIGRRAANSVLDSKVLTSSGGFMGMSTSEQWKLIGLWVFGIIAIGQINGVANFFFVILGWIPIAMFIKARTRRKERNLSLSVIEKIESVVNESRTIGMRGFEEWEETKSSLVGNLYVANKYLDLSTKMLNIFKSTLSKYDLETTIKLCSGNPWIGMSKDHVLHMKGGEPDKREVETIKDKSIETFIYGNKYSGDVFKFEDGVLVSFKDR
jgi:hypothetical protein